MEAGGGDTWLNFGLEMEGPSKMVTVYKQRSPGKPKESNAMSP